MVRLIAAVLVVLTVPAYAALFPPEMDLSDLFPANGGDGSAGFVIAGARFEGALGLASSAQADINDDGLADIAVCHDDPSRLYVLFGRSEPYGPEFNADSLLATNGGTGNSGFVMHNGATGSALALFRNRA